MSIPDDEFNKLLEDYVDPKFGFKRIHKGFLDSLNSLEQLIEQSRKNIDRFFEESDKEIESVITKSDEKTKSDWKNYVKWRNDSVEFASLGRQTPKFVFTSDTLAEILKTKHDENIRKIQSFDKFQVKFIGEMSLVYLISKFESFLYDALRYVFYLEPRILKFQLKDTMISYEELFFHDDFKQLKKSIAEKEAKKLIDDYNVHDLIKKLNKKINFPDLTKDKNWKRFQDAFLRRNLIIHSDGIADEKYYSAVGRKKPKNMTMTLYVNQQYMEMTISLFRNYLEIINKFFIENFVHEVEGRET